MEHPGSPISNPDVFDLLGARKDGGVDAVIVCDGPLDKSETTLHNLGIKIRNYLREMASENFVEQFGSGPTSIFVSCSHAVSFEAKQLVAKLALEAARQDVLLQFGEPVA
jgi:hypothetical protein